MWRPRLSYTETPLNRNAFNPETPLNRVNRPVPTVVLDKSPLKSANPLIQKTGQQLFYPKEDKVLLSFSSIAGDGETPLYGKKSSGHKILIY